MLIGLLLTISQYSPKLNKIGEGLIFIAFFGAIIFITIKNNWLKLFGMLLLLVTSQVATNFKIFFSVFLPTLIHVFVFTGCFILFGALKSRSKSGIISFIVFLLCPLAFFFLFKDVSFIEVTAYGKAAYQKFEGLNYYIFKLFSVQDAPTHEAFVQQTYYSSFGIIAMRFIAFAYTYHYLNWFSKTSVIKWHEVPKGRLAFVVGLWIVSVVLYAVDYNMGFEWLFFLSFLHVLLEFPLNHLSFAGIFNETKTIFKNRSFSLPPPEIAKAIGKKK